MSYVVEIQYFDPDDSTVKVMLVGTEGFATRPTDTPPNVEVRARVKEPAFLRRDIFDTGTTGGLSRTGYGELVLTNEDGSLDVLNTYGLDGRTLTVRVAATNSVAYPSGYSVLFSGTMEEIQVGSSEVRIRLRDRQVFMERDIQANLYSGTNVLPAGVDGIVSDLKGKPKPILYGACFNVEPVMVNTSKLIYQVNDGALRDVTAVYDAGAMLGRGEDYATQAEMESTEPEPGAYRIWKSGGMFRLGAAPFGQITCDAVEGTWPMDRTAAQIFKKVLIERAGRTLGEISTADLSALDAVQSATIGVYIQDTQSVSRTLDQIAQSVGAWWSTDSSGLIRFKRLEAPSGTPVLLMTKDNIDGLSRIPINNGGIPVYRVTVRCVPNYTVQNSGLVGQVSAARRARLAQPYQDGIAEDSAVRTQYVLSPELVVETLIACRNRGETEALRLLDLYKVKRDRYELVFSAKNIEELSLVDLGAVVSISFPRFGLASGKLFRILGFQLDPIQNKASLTVWG